MIEIQNLSRNLAFKQFKLLSSENSVELADLEKNLTIGNSIPEGLKSFLIKYNGGTFNESLFINDPVSPVVIATFLPISDEASNSINKTYKFFKNEIGDGFIPFGCDPGGNYFLLGSKDINWNKVYFWDHERHLVNEISGSFEDFMNALIVDD
jgi:SMI1-KNR4 cell-wall